jgi:hypothetical protein
VNVQWVKKNSIRSINNNDTIIKNTCDLPPSYFSSLY